MRVQQGQQYAKVTAGSGEWTSDLSREVLSDVTIKHGRELYEWGKAAMSTAQFTVAIPRGDLDYWYLGHVGGLISVYTGIGPDPETPFDADWAEQFAGLAADQPIWNVRFTGHITDILYEWEEHPVNGWMLMHRVQCVGLMSRLGSRLVAGTFWAEEKCRARASYILNAAWNWTGETWRLEPGDYNPTFLQVVDRDESRPALLDLEDLSGPGEAILFDRPNGEVTWQELTFRKTTPTVDLPADGIVFAPGFAETLDLVNTLTLEYGIADPRATVEALHNESRFFLGIWAERYSTEYRYQYDAQLKADRVVRRQGWPPVLMPAVDVLLNRLDYDTWTAVRTLRVGHRVRLPAMPDPYPIDSPGQASGVWIVEGWTEHVGSRDNPDDEWKLTLHLSPPIWSLVGQTWDELPDTKTWDEYVASGETWDELGEL